MADRDRDIAAETIFAAAVARATPGERASYVELACGGDAELRDWVRALLAAHDAAGGFLVGPPAILNTAFPHPGATPPGGQRAPGSDVVPAGPAGWTKVRYFGEYELLEEIARGGMGVVYRARQARLGRVVALKMILAGHFASPDEVRRFEVEASKQAGLDHPNIVPIYEVGRHAGQHFFTMKLIRGGSLATAEARAPFAADPRAAAALIATVARAVHHAHRRGLLHRDLKPGNILVDGDGRPQVSDFGLARELDGAEAGRDPTRPGAILGSPRYMAPEQARGEAGLTVGTDVWGLGAVLYELVGGRPAFDAATVGAVLEQVKGRDPPRPSTLSAKVDRDLETVCLKCLEKDPGRRYASAQDLADDLDRWRRGEPVAARPVGRTARAWRWCRRNRPLAAAAGFAVAATVGVVITLAIAVTLIGRSRDANVDLAAEKGELAREERSLRVTAQSAAARRLFEAALDRCAAADGPAEGMLWLCRSLDEAVLVGDAGIERSVRLQLAAWGPRLYRLEAVNSFQDASTIFEHSFSRDRSKVLTVVHRGDEDKAYVLFETATMRRLGVRIEFADEVALSPDGRLAAVAVEPTDDRPKAAGSVPVARLVDAVTAKPAGPPLLGTYDVEDITFAPDGKSVLAIDANRQVVIWDVATGRLLATHDTRTSPADPFDPYFISLSPTGNRLALCGTGAGGTGGRGGEVRVWDLPSWKRVGAPFCDPAGLSRATFTPAGTDVLIGGELVRRWACDAGTPVGPTLAHGSRISTLSVSDDGTLALTGGDQLLVRLWHLPTGTQVGSPLPHSWRILGAAFTPDGRSAVTISPLEVATWRLPAWRPFASRAATTGGRRPASPPPSSPPAAATAPDGGAIVARRADAIASWTRGGAGVSVSDPRAGATSPRRVLPHPADTDRLVAAFSPDGRLLVTAVGDGSVRVWDVADGRLVGPVLHHRGAARSVELSTPSSNTDMEDALAKRFSTGRGEPPSVEMSPDHRVLSTRGDGFVVFWDTASWKPIGMPSPDGPGDAPSDRATRPATAPDGTSVLRAPAPLEGSPLRIKRWVEATTGMELDEGGRPRLLFGPDTSSDGKWSSSRWLARHAEMLRLGGPPLP